MWYFRNGKLGAMMYDTRKKKLVFIPEKKWDRMSPSQRARFI